MWNKQRDLSDLSILQMLAAMPNYFLSVHGVSLQVVKEFGKGSLFLLLAIK